MITPILDYLNYICDNLWRGIITGVVVKYMNIIKTKIKPSLRV